MEIFLPSNFEDTEIVNFLNELIRHKDDDDICTNYSKVKFVKPYATLLLAIGFREFIHYRKEKGLKTTSKGHKDNNASLSYLQHLGFFQYIGLNIGKMPNEARGSTTYLPITVLKAEQFSIKGQRLQDAIVTESDRLARVIYPDVSNISRADMLSYSLREIIRNVFEHANIDECLVVAQSWANGLAEIAIADRGIGLSKSLMKAHNIKDSKDAISIAVKPGISSETAEVNDDKWQNSGFGLYVVSELGSMLGEFAIASDNEIMFSQKSNRQWYGVPIQGTAVKLKVDTNEADYFPNVLKNIVEEGEKLAKGIPGARKAASKMSKMNDIKW